VARRVRGAVAAAPELAAQARLLLAQGLSKRAIAVRLGVSEATLYRSLRREETRSREHEAGSELGTARQGSVPAGPQRCGKVQIPETTPDIRSRIAAAQANEADDGYPEALVRRVPRDFTPILPRRHYLALLRAADRAGSAAAGESRRQALLLHAEPMIPPPTSIELVLSAAEEAELKLRELGHLDVPASALTRYRATDSS
jgi:hypothetical protein